MTPTSSRVLAAAAVTLLVLTGCSGSDEAAPPTTPAATTPSTTVTTTVPPTTVPATSPPTTLDPWCAPARQLEETDDFLDSKIIVDPEALEAGITSWLADLSASQPFAPEAIRDDVQTTIDVITSLDEAFAAVDYQVLDVDLSTIQGLDSDLAEAATAIEAYNLAVCGIVADDDNGVGSTDEPGDGFDPTAGSVREQAVASFVEQGFTPEEAACLVDQIDLASAGGTTVSIAPADVFTACGITAERLLELGG